jgi:hypothetical protein
LTILASLDTPRPKSRSPSAPVYAQAGRPFDPSLFNKDANLRARRRFIKGLRGLADALEDVPRGAPAAPSEAAQLVLDEYVAGAPSAQNAIDALPGWNQALPADLNVVAGQGAFYNDSRILWAIEQLGTIAGKRILELGPLEASHTWLLEQHGAAAIDAIEANKLSYLRCLVVKELLDMKRAKFHLGDFAKWLEAADRRYDMIVASGVLYHMEDPVRLLELIAARTDAFYLWTHYVSDEAMPRGDPRRGALIGAAETQESHGVQVRLHKRSYYGAWRSKSFCGGMHDLHRWIEKADIVALIGALGFDDLRIAHDDPAHQNGPSFSIFARRSAATPPPESHSA